MSRRIGVDLSSTRAVLANVGETRRGVQLHGFAFVEAEGALDVIAADLREARQTYRFPRASEVVARPGDARVDAVKRAGFRIERVITPGEALARVARLHYRGQPMSGVLAVVSLHPASGAVAVVRDGRLLFETELAWNAAAPVSAADSELLRRYTFVSELTESLRRVFETVRMRQGINVTEILTCGSLTDLRSLTMPLAAEFDVEVETLDLTDDVEIRVRDASPEQMRDTIASLRVAIAAGKRWHKRTFKEIAGRLRVPRLSLATRAAALAAACVVLVFVWVRYEKPATTTRVPAAARTTALTAPASRPPSTVPAAPVAQARVAPPKPPITARPLRVNARLHPVPAGIPHASLALALAKAEQDIAVSAADQRRAQTSPPSQTAHGATPPVAATNAAATPASRVAAAPTPAQRVAAAPIAAPRVAPAATPAPVSPTAAQKPALTAAAAAPPPAPKTALHIAAAPAPRPTIAGQKPALKAAATAPPPVPKIVPRVAAAPTSTSASPTATQKPAPVPSTAAQKPALTAAATVPPPVAKPATRIAAAAPTASNVSKPAPRVATETRPAAIPPAVPKSAARVATSTDLAVPPSAIPKTSSPIAASAPASAPVTKRASAPTAATPRSAPPILTSKPPAPNATADLTADAALIAPRSPAATAWSPGGAVVKPSPDRTAQPITSVAGGAPDAARSASTQPRVAAKPARSLLPAPADVVVSSILWSDDRQLAIVNSRIVGAGDVVGRQTVVEIEANAVVFRDPAGRLRRASLRQDP